MSKNLQLTAAEVKFLYSVSCERDRQNFWLYLREKQAIEQQKEEEENRKSDGSPQDSFCVLNDETSENAAEEEETSEQHKTPEISLCRNMEKLQLLCEQFNSEINGNSREQSGKEVSTKSVSMPPIEKEETSRLNQMKLPNSKDSRPLGVQNSKQISELEGSHHTTFSGDQTPSEQDDSEEPESDCESEIHQNCFGYSPIPGSAEHRASIHSPSINQCTRDPPNKAIEFSRNYSLNVNSYTSHNQSLGNASTIQPPFCQNSQFSSQATLMDVSNTTQNRLFPTAAVSSQYPLDPQNRTCSFTVQPSQCSFMSDVPQNSSYGCVVYDNSIAKPASLVQQNGVAPTQMLPVIPIIPNYPARQPEAIPGHLDLRVTGTGNGMDKRRLQPYPLIWLGIYKSVRVYDPNGCGFDETDPITIYLQQTIDPRTIHYVLECSTGIDRSYILFDPTRQGCNVVISGNQMETRNPNSGLIDLWTFTSNGLTLKRTVPGGLFWITEFVRVS